MNFFLKGTSESQADAGAYIRNFPLPSFQMLISAFFYYNDY